MEEKLCPGCELPEIDKKPPCPLQCRSAQCKSYQTRSKFDPDTKPIVWILGGPGCGKFTQCKKIINDYGFTHLSTGDIIRDEVASGSDRAKCLTSIMDRGGLVPNELVLQVLKEAMEAAADKSRGYLVDGYPREKSQGAAFERTVGRVSLILYFEATEETLVKRMLQRGETSGRADDKPEIMRMRIATFLKNNAAVIAPYGDRVVRINAEQPVDDVYAHVKRAMEPVVARAEAIEAQIAEARALEKAKAVRAYARSSMAVIASRTVLAKGSKVNVKDLLTNVRAATAAAEAEVAAARQASQAAIARVAAAKQAKVKVLAPIQEDKK